jgi:hypothetical protein
MRVLLFLLALLDPLLSGQVANAERKLPADLQVDLIFPRNETYAPTQLFPIVFGVNNLDAVWPLGIRLAVTVESIGVSPEGGRPSWMWQDVSLNYGQFAEAVGQVPSKRFFHFPAVNMTNGTTDSFQVLWNVILADRCFANNTDPEDDDGGDGWWNSPDGFASRGVRFSTAPGAQRPDIEAAVTSCPEPNEDNSAAIRITDVRTTYDEHKPCPVLDTNVKPTKCVFKSTAKELAANVSAAMLREMGCQEGNWQTITAPCPREESIASPQAAGFGVRWVLLALTVAVSNIL